MDAPAKVLIVDDEPDMLSNCTRILRRCGYHCLTADTSEQGLSLVGTVQPDVVLVDLRMPGKSGIEIVKSVKARYPAIEVVLMTAYATIETAVDAIKQGAFDYLPKPFTADQLQAVIQRTLYQKQSTEATRRLTAELTGQSEVGDMVGMSEAMRALRDSIRKVASTEATVLITGESGTGKELVARNLHQLSRRRVRPFVPVDCAALPESLLESELFGHEKGAFTGASMSRPGLFELAHTGTLFLDEVAELPLPLQAKLLRVLEARQLRRLGGRQLISVDVRLLAATNRDLPSAMAAGAFRQDLFYRLNVIPIHVPPLRERRGDIALLAVHFLLKGSAGSASQPKGFDPEAVARLEAYGWPGNVRELKNMVERMRALANRELIRPEDLPAEVRQPSPERADRLPPAHSFKAAKQEIVTAFEARSLRQLMERTGWNIAQAARASGVHRKTIERKLKQYNLRRDD
ncbi:MAG TPA: sigma-54 dependent transcriptional regulator [Candidatus Tectomicrobia bacterium]|nr:sigma-54 dependent transcriptional regulator [Candidatus Tectomicrobia bacterium]